MLRILYTLALCLLIHLPLAESGQRLKDEGVVKGFVTDFDCVGAGIICDKTGIVGSLTVDGVANDLVCTDCIGATEIEDIYVFNSGDTMSGNLTISTATNPTFATVDTTNGATNVFQSQDTFGLIGTTTNHSLFFLTNNIVAASFNASQNTTLNKNVTIGDGSAGVDFTLAFDGETNDFLVTWREDEDRLDISDELLLTTTEKMLFGDTGTFIHQSSDGNLLVEADTLLTLGIVGDITLGDSTERNLLPDTDLKINVGTSTKRINDFNMGGDLVLGPNTELTIATGVVTITGSLHTIDTQSDASTDDLDTINGGQTGQIVVLRSANDARDTTLTQNGNIKLSGTSFVLTNQDDVVMLLFDGTDWLAMVQSNNS